MGGLQLCCGERELWREMGVYPRGGKRDKRGRREGKGRERRYQTRAWPAAQARSAHHIFFFCICCHFINTKCLVAGQCA